MAYRLDPALPVVDEVRRALDEQLSTGIEQLRLPGGPDAEAVHDVRRRIKKARSLLRLARAQYGATLVRLAQAELRTVAASLADQREADARTESLTALAARLDGPDADLILGLAPVLAAADPSGGGLDRRTVLGALSQLQRTSGWLARLPARTHGWSAIEPGLARQYAAGRRDLRRLPDRPSAYELHEWRKRAKDLWYHERLLRGAWPAGLKPVVRAAGAVADLLGDDHDLALVAAALGAPVQVGLPGEPLAPPLPVRVSAAERARVLVHVAARRNELQHEARRLGGLLWADSPRAWVERHHRWWKQASADPSPPATTA